MYQSIKNMKKYWLLYSIPFLSFLPIFFIFSIFNGFYAHDSLERYISYTYQFDAFNDFKEIPLWNPYISYGLSQTSNLFVTSSAEFLSIITGSLFSKNSNLFFYNLSIILNTFLYIGSIALILQKLKLKKISILYATILAALTINPIHQVGFDFNLISKIPPLIFLLIYFFDNPSKRLQFFIFSFLYLIVCGTLIYFIVVIFYILIVFSLAYLYQSKVISRPSFTLNKLDLIMMGLSLFFIMTYLIHINDLLNNFVILSPARTEDGLVSFDDWLNYGGFTEINKMYGLFGEKIYSLDFDLFIGIIPIFLSFFCLNIKDKYTNYVSKSLIAVAIFVIIFSNPISKIIHQIFFYLPGMSYVRHISYMSIILKPILILLSAIGLNNILLKDEYFKQSFKKTITLILFFYLFCLVGLIYKEDIFTILISILALLIILKSKKTNKISLVILLLFVIINVLHHRISVFPNKDYELDPNQINNIRNNDFPFITKRIDPEISTKQRFFNYLVNFRNKKNTAYADYDSNHVFFREDYCYPYYRNDLIHSEINKTLSKNKLNFNPTNIKFDNDSDFSLSRRKVVGCNRYKIENLNNFDSSIEHNINIKTFTPNQISIDIENLINEEEHYIYYDAYHPYWKLFINSKLHDIKIVNGFKSFKINKGKNLVEFKISKGYIILETLRAYISSIVFSLFIFMIILKLKND